ncbi:MAG: dephospho-CoA kinase [Bosea sp. (in: a-proteobacteria)]
MTFVLGLTGSIGMGKTTTANLFREMGTAVHDADATVHALYRGVAVPLVEAVFPGVTVDGAVDRTKLSAQVLGKPEAMARLERIIHPLVREAEQAFLASCLEKRAPVAVLDIPLLLETGHRRSDAIIVVTAPPDVQRTRVLARPGMTPERFEAILARQMPDAQKRRKAHFIVDTSRGLLSARQQVRSILRAIAGRSGQNLSG